MLNFDPAFSPTHAPAFDGYLHPHAATAKRVVVLSDDAALRQNLALRLRVAGYEVVQKVPADIGKLADLAADCILAEFDASWSHTLLDTLKRRHCPVPVIFAAPRSNVPTVVALIKAGAKDFIEYLRNSVDLGASVEEACARGAKLREEAAEADVARGAIARLSPRERDVMKELVKGSANKVAAIALGISPRTVEIHRTHIMRKLGVKSVANLVRLAEHAPDLVQ